MMCNINIWNRALNLKTIYECYGDEEVTKSQQESLERFISDAELDKALPAVKRYCLEDENMTEETKIENIFKYVIPRAIFVKRNNRKRIVAVVCDYKLDEEHGLAIVFENERFKRITNEGDI